MARDLLLRGMLAGALAGLLAFGFATLFGEPQVELAIGFETSMQHAAGHMREPELVSRGVQRGIGLLVACVAIGVALGGILAIVFTLAYQRIGQISAVGLAVLLASAGFIVVALVPQLKYPANPPAIGTEETIGLRTALHFEMIVIALGSLVLAVLLGRLLTTRLTEQTAFLLGALFFICMVGALQFMLPTINEVPEGFPTDVLWRFRLASLGTQFVLWAGLGAIFSVLARRSLHA
jgi:predicted cobalt transporter CbtA